MLNSRWKIHRIGLVDFWYYDDEEFYFADGRMLLRGANGSGKSVTMQSFIPLLLDGNKSPSRLDPFGTNARQIGNYLLEENDGREERTGYLYMEFKREDSETFLTVGMGLKATRRSGKVDSWYFSITDGRRVGKDFWLYRQGEQKICLSKTELRNRIAEGGLVLDSQKDYMELVNRLLFGFGTEEEYKELINLLIQLRTPKLSKDFKPTLINEILSNSLQPLSEEDLRPMSEAVENMDNLETNLNQLRESKKAADRIMSVYQQYNQVLLYEKATMYVKSGTILKELAEEARQNTDLTVSYGEKAQSALRRKLQLEGEQQAAAEQKRDLEKNDVVELKERQMQLHQELAQTQEELDKQETRHDEKREKRVELVAKEKLQKEKLQAAEKEMSVKLAEMDEAAQTAYFEEHFFMKDDLSKALNTEYDFQMVKKMAHSLEDRITEGLETVNKAEVAESGAEAALQKLDDEKKERQRLERNGLLLENQFTETKAELQEKLHHWNQGNEMLCLAADKMHMLNRFVENYETHPEPFGLKELAREDKIITEEEHARQRMTLMHERSLLEEEKKELGKELREWQTKADPEPEREEAVLKNRQNLKKRRIAFQPFYRLLDFSDRLTAQEADLLEESLLRMGILDALVVAEEDREKVLHADVGLCDKYLFCDTKMLGENLASLLTVNSGSASAQENSAGEADLAGSEASVASTALVASMEKGGWFQKRVTDLLKSLGTKTAAPTYVDMTGSYGIGLLKGTVTKEYKAKYIGVEARARFRRQMMETLQAKLDAQTELLRENESRIALVEEKIKQLNEEFAGLPNAEDVHMAWKDLTDNEEALKRQQRIVESLEEETKELQRHFAELKNRFLTIAKAANIPAEKSAFAEAKQAMRAYGAMLSDLMVSFHNCLKLREILAGLAEQIRDVDADVDDILYEIGKQQRKKEDLHLRLQKCDEQLAVSDYEQIKAQLDHCLKRLREIPQEIQEAIIENTNAENQLQRLKEEMKSNAAKSERQRMIHELVERAFHDEYQLGYVVTLAEEERGKRTLESYLCDKLSAGLPDKPKEELLRQLQDRYFENRAFLAEYNLNQVLIFDYQEAGALREGDSFSGSQSFQFQRTDLVGKFRGKQMKFQELAETLNQDIAEQENLLRDSDRELFEEILANTISRKIRARIYNSEDWVRKMNRLMETMNTSSGLSLSLVWKSKHAEQEEQMDTKELVELLKRDAELMGEREFGKLSDHFRSKIQEARKTLAESDKMKTFYLVVKEVLDYRKWFEFQLYYRKRGEAKKELTDRVFNAFSGGEKAITMYVPLFSAVVAKYSGAREDSARLISLDEAFAGVDENNIKDLFRMMVELEFNFIINSQVLWGDYETVPELAIYQLLRPENAKFVTVMPYHWNGNYKKTLERADEMND